MTQEMPQTVYVQEMSRNNHGRHGVWADKDDTNGYAKPYVPADKSDRLIDLLEIMWDGYENGVPCHENTGDPEELGSFMGNAFELDADIEAEICGILNSRTVAPKPDPATVAVPVEVVEQLITALMQANWIGGKEPQAADGYRIFTQADWYNRYGKEALSLLQPYTKGER